MVVLPVLFLLGSLFLCGPVEAQTEISEIMKEAAMSYDGPLTCDKWDCNCTFTRQRGCCCAANELFELEDETYMRFKNVWHSISSLSERIHTLIGNTKISFTARMDPNIAVRNPGDPDRCFGPFNANVPIPYTIVTLNDGLVYNPALGVFTACTPGVYVFSCTVYSNVQKGERMSHKVQLMKNGVAMVGVWENNREDGEDSATQVVILSMNKGDQVYMELISGKKLCNRLQYNVFTGYILYPGVAGLSDM